MERHPFQAVMSIIFDLHWKSVFITFLSLENYFDSIGNSVTSRCTILGNVFVIDILSFLFAFCHALSHFENY